LVGWRGSIVIGVWYMHVWMNSNRLAVGGGKRGNVRLDVISDWFEYSVYIAIQLMSLFSLYSIYTGEKIKTANRNKINRILCNLPHMGRLWHAMETWGDAMACYVAGLWHHVVI